MATAVANGEMRRGFALRLPERLPDLKGKWLTLYSVLWAAALVVAVVAPIATTVSKYQGLGHPVWRPHGVVTNTDDSGITVIAVFGDEARRAGVRAGDRIVAVDGWRIVGRKGADHLFKLLDGPEGSVDTLTLLSPSGAERDVSVPTRASTAAQMFRGTGFSRGMFDAATQFFDLAFLLLLVPAAVLLFIRRRREIVPALLSMSFLVIAGFIGGRDALVVAGVSDKLGDSIANLLGWLPLVLALIAFPDGRYFPKLTAAAVLLALLATVNDLSSRLDGVDNAAVGITFILAATALVLRYRRHPADLRRQQLRWAFLGFFAGISLLVIVLPLLIAGNQLTAADPRWAVWVPITGNILAGLSFPCMALGLMVSVLRYRLYDADLVIGRSAAYGVLTLGFVGLFAGTEKLAEVLGERYFEHSIGIAAGAIGAAVAAAVVVPLHNRVHRWAERRFQKPLIRLREGLPECVADLRDTAGPREIADAVMKRVEAGVRATRGAVLLREGAAWTVAGLRNVAASEVADWLAQWSERAEDRTLDCQRHDPLFPLRVRLCIETADEPETLGWLLLGPRPDGSFFGRDERETLEHVAGAVARALHVAQGREDRDRSAEARLSGLEALVAKLAAGLASGSSKRAVQPS